MKNHNNPCSDLHPPVDGPVPTRETVKSREGLIGQWFLGVRAIYIFCEVSNEKHPTGVAAADAGTPDDLGHGICSSRNGKL